MKITVFNNQKLDTSIEWDETNKIAIFISFNSFGKEEYKRVVEGCNTLDEAKKAIKPV